MLNKKSSSLKIISIALLLLMFCCICGFIIPTPIASTVNAATSDKVVTKYVETYKSNFLKYLNKYGGSYSFYKTVEEGETMTILYKDDKTYTVDYNQDKELLSTTITQENRRHKDQTVTLSTTSLYTEGSSAGVSTSLTVGVGGGVFVNVKAVGQFDFDFVKSISNTKENKVSVSIPIQITSSEYLAIKDTEVYKFYSYSYTDPTEGAIYALKTGQYSLLSKVQVTYYYYFTLKKAQVYETQKTTNKGKTENKDVNKAEKIWVLENDSNRIKYTASSRSYSVSTNIEEEIVCCMCDMSKPSYSVAKIK